MSRKGKVIKFHRIWDRPEHDTPSPHTVPADTDWSCLMST